MISESFRPLNAGLSHFKFKIAVSIAQNTLIDGIFQP